jgi:DNA invertase Pin-like site-specific DNA recombinase
VRAAIYLRVSTDEQATANQHRELVGMLNRRHPGVHVDVFADEGVSGSKMSRPSLDGMMAQARKGRFDLVAVWALDRLGRSMQGVVALVLELDRLGVQVVSLQESWLDTGGPVRSLLLAIFGWVAEQERARLIERTRAGLERAKREGKPIGRPRTSPASLAAASKAAEEGLTLKAAAERYGTSPRTLKRYMEENGKNPCSETIKKMLVPGGY